MFVTSLLISIFTSLVLSSYPVIPDVQYQIMGWNSWNTFLCNVNETVIKETADAFIRLDLPSLGYEYIIIDDCWASETRLPNGSLIWNATRFPSGIPAIAQYVHQKGLKLGIYSDVGKKTCQGRPGSYGYYRQDAETFSKWGVDYLKLDFCDLAFDEFLEPWDYYVQMSNALQNQNREIVFAICNWGLRDTTTWAPEMANSWRISSDIFPAYFRVIEILEDNQDLYASSGQYRFNDMDMLEVGVKGTILNHPSLPETSLTVRESQSHFALWSILRSPLILGNDLRNIQSQMWVLDIVKNQKVISLNRDPLALQAQLLSEIRKGVDLDGYCLEQLCSFTQIYGKALKDGAGVVLFNRADPFDQNSTYFKEEMIQFEFSLLNLPRQKSYSCENLLTGETFSCFNSLKALVQPHGAEVFKIKI